MLRAAAVTSIILQYESSFSLSVVYRSFRIRVVGAPEALFFRIAEVIIRI
ncbi:hypothetical protein HNR07_000216 [Nocardiopsis metallicus]|uniref:Uncharacterized protein n=1 Tax=Nocardiopsis metallicus TaxID=179819 RepID=A0A840VXJ0_9ACTN|nr:hypothetical protein [Nocardiopsis metallicus]